jgi:hypothetical protein
MASPGERRRRAVRGWLLPLLCLAVPALVVVVPWTWHRRRERRLPSLAVQAPLRLAGDGPRDRQAILTRAAALLRGSVPAPGPSEAGPASRAARLGEIGIELLALDPARGAEVVESAIAMAAGTSERRAPVRLNPRERSRTGVLVNLAQSLAAHRQLALADRALRAAVDAGGRERHVPSRIYALCRFSYSAATLDPALARSALRKARGAYSALPAAAPADLAAAVAAATARVEGKAAARGLVERAVEAVPQGAARPLAEARLATWLAEAAPERARELAGHAMADLLSEAQRRAVATLLAPAHPRLAMALAARLRPPQERFEALMEMGGAAEGWAPAPAAAAPLFRQALREARILPEGPGRAAAVMAAATGLAAYDLGAALGAVTSGGGSLSGAEKIRLGARAMGSRPEAGTRLIASVPPGDPALQGFGEESEEIACAVTAAEPDPGRALARAQQWRDPGVRAAALLTVARRLPTRRSEG